MATPNPVVYPASVSPPHRRLRSGSAVVAVLVTMLEHGDGLYSSDIRRETGLPQGSVLPALNRLVKAGYAEAEADPDKTWIGKNGVAHPRIRYSFTTTGRSWADTFIRKVAVAKTTTARPRRQRAGSLSPAIQP